MTGARRPEVLTVDQAIREALRSVGTDTAIESTHPLGGGCIHDVLGVHLSDGTRVVAKTNVPRAARLFDEEADSLARLTATGTVPVPSVIAHGVWSDRAVLLLTEVARPATVAAWRQLGEDLAALHAADVGVRFGLERDNHIGATPQPNAWADDWVEFNARRRLGYQLDLAASHGRLETGEATAIAGVIDRLERLIPRRPRPALLHGDLWSGNAMPTSGDRVVVIDPACSIGDGWADIAMMQLFGGFDPACFEAYAAGVPERDDVERRIAVYQLYHVLNHVNLFGRGYVGQAMGLVRRLG